MVYTAIHARNQLGLKFEVAHKKIFVFNTKLCNLVVHSGRHRIHTWKWKKNVWTPDMIRLNLPKMTLLHWIYLSRDYYSLIGFTWTLGVITNNRLLLHWFLVSFCYESETTGKEVIKIWYEKADGLKICRCTEPALSWTHAISRHACCKCLT